MMVSCPGCNNQYSLDERKFPSRGAAVTCVQCGKKWTVRPPSLEQAPAPASPTTAPARGPSPRIEQKAEAIHATETPAAASVSCPQCGHSFVPSGQGATAPSGGSAGPRRILIIEDQNYFAELTRDALGGEFETTVVSSVAGARSAMTTGRFDLVILDLSLEEGQDGAQLLGTIGRQKTPVLVFTARDETELYGETWKSLQGAGATDILIKGVNVGEELRQKVKALLAAPRP